MMYKKTLILSIQLIVGFCFFAFSLSLSQAEVTLTIGSGSGLPSSNENPVAVSLFNTNDLVAGVQLDICDEDDYLTIPKIDGCETTERTTGFWCLANKPVDGCCKVILIHTGGGLIEEGTGPIFTLKYDVSEGAPSGECKNLDPENVTVLDEINQSLDVTLVPGGFCFSCTSDEDCDDGLYCNGAEICVDGACHPGVEPCPETECNTCQEDIDSCLDPDGTTLY